MTKLESLNEDLRALYKLIIQFLDIKDKSSELLGRDVTKTIERLQTQIAGILKEMGYAD